MTAEQLQDQTEAAGGASAVERGVGHRGTMRQDRPVCPHCGYEHDDAWEWDFGPGLEGDSEGRECYRCGEAFDCERIVDVSYTTKVPNAAVRHGATRGEECGHRRKARKN